MLVYDRSDRPIEYFHMTSRRPYWCPKPILWELNSVLMQTLSCVPINLHRCWPREWKRSITCVSCGDLYFYKKDLFKGGWRSAERFFKQNYCHARFAVFFPLPCSFVSSLIKQWEEQRVDMQKTGYSHLGGFLKISNKFIWGRQLFWQRH